MGNQFLGLFRGEFFQVNKPDVIEDRVSGGFEQAQLMILATMFPWLLGNLAFAERVFLQPSQDLLSTLKNRLGDACQSSDMDAVTPVGPPATI